jgi:hypothetical protein
MVMYPRRMALSRVVLEGEPRERETYVANAASLRLEMGGVVGLMEKAEISETRLGGVRWGLRGCVWVVCGVATRSHQLV